MNRLRDVLPTLVGRALISLLFVHASVLLLALQPTNVVGHDFWGRSDPRERSMERVAFTKNLAATGGLIMAASRRHRRTP